MNKPVKIKSTHFNLAMACDHAKRGPVLVDFFGNGCMMLSTEQFMGLRPTDLADLQAQIRVAMALTGTKGSI